MPLLTKPAPFEADTQWQNYNDPSRGAESAAFRFTMSQADNLRRQQHAQQEADYESQQRELTRRMGQIDREEQDNIASGNRDSNNMLNKAALASARRKAGGTTFRRRGSSVTPNSLVSGLGTANAKSLAAARRATATNEVAAGIGWRRASVSTPQYTIGSPVAVRYN